MESSTLFVVRVWRQVHRGRSAFRASARAVDAEHERVFTRPAELAQFLARASVDDTPPTDPVPATPRSNT